MLVDVRNESDIPIPIAYKEWWKMAHSHTTFTTSSEYFQHRWHTLAFSGTRPALAAGEDFEKENGKGTIECTVRLDKNGAEERYRYVVELDRDEREDGSAIKTTCQFT